MGARRGRRTNDEKCTSAPRTSLKKAKFVISVANYQLWRHFRNVPRPTTMPAMEILWNIDMWNNVVLSIYFIFSVSFLFHFAAILLSCIKKNKFPKIATVSEIRMLRVKNRNFRYGKKRVSSPKNLKILLHIFSWFEVRIFISYAI